jgi:hypothetical protein
MFFCFDYKAKTWSFNGANIFSLLSGHSNIVGKLCLTCGDANERDLGNKDVYKETVNHLDIGLE